MAEQMRPASPQQAPDPANSYERSHPEQEAGAGRMDNNKSTPTARPDQMEQAVKNKQESRQINAHNEADMHNKMQPKQPEHSMHDEEPLDVDLAPTDINDPKSQRHPRREGKGGTP
jgi:hypothetical protein